MKTLKKAIILCIFLLVIGLINCTNVNASTGGYSAEDAINWCRSVEGEWIRTGQCVTFVSEYYSVLGQQTPSYYSAYELINHVSDQPAGWQVIRDSNVQPQMGDILVYSGGAEGDGHVCIYEADNATWHANWGEGSGKNGTVVRWSGTYYKSFSGFTFLGVVRPDFVTAPVDNESPVFHSGEIVLSSINSNSFKVRVNATDNVGIDYINLGVKTETEDWTWNGMTSVGNDYYEYTVTTSGRNSKTGVYRIDCYAFDKAKNSSGLQVGYHIMGSTIKTSLGNFTARIACKNNTNYVIGTVDESSTFLHTTTTYAALNSKNNSNLNQIWKFEKQSDNSYKIINSSNSKVLGVKSSSDNEEAKLIVSADKNADNQKFYIMNYNGGYRFVPKCSKTVKGLGLSSEDLSENKKIQLYTGKSSASNSQTFKIEKVTYSNGLNKVNGTWYYYNNNVVDTSYTGLVKYNGVWFYIEKGLLNWNANTLVKYNNVWFYVKNGSVDWNYEGLFKYNGVWFYIQRGSVNWNANTLVKYNNVWFYVKNGSVNWNYEGLFNYNGTRFYIKKGTIQWDYNGIITFEGKKYTIKKGAVV